MIEISRKDESTREGEHTSLNEEGGGEEGRLKIQKCTVPLPRRLVYERAPPLQRRRQLTRSLTATGAGSQPTRSLTATAAGSQTTRSLTATGAGSQVRSRARRTFP